MHTSSSKDEYSARKSVRGRFALWTLLCALFIVYSSVIGPDGINYVPMDLGEAWRRFLATPYHFNGSDQRADWMGNLLMFIPMGFLMTGIVYPRQSVMLRWVNSLLALILCIIFLLAVKFLQLLFPPRTVTLNYIIAQSSGAAVGVLLFWASFSKSLRLKDTRNVGAIILILLEIYAWVYLLFALLPFDFTLSAADLHERLLGVPRLLFSWPDAGRPIDVRLSIVIAEVLAAIPLGFLLGVKAGERSPVWVFVFGFTAMATITLLKIFVISGTPYLVSILYRTAGVLLGVFFVKRITPKHVKIFRAGLLRFLPILAAIYVLAVIDVNGLISLHWRTLSQAQDALDPRGLLPFWHSYIVPKAHAFESQAAHVVMFLPIGIMLSLRRRGRPTDAWIAALLAFSFALAVEVGRWFRPDLQPDFYEAAIAAIAAGLAVKPMTRLWSILEDEMADYIKGDGPEKFYLGRAAPLPNRFSNGWTKVPIVLRSEQITFLERVPGCEEHSLSGATRHVIGLFIKRLAGDEPDAQFRNDEPSVLEIMGGRREDETGHSRRERGHRQVVNLPKDYAEFLSGLSVKLGTTMSRTVQMILDDFIAERMKKKSGP